MKSSYKHVASPELGLLKVLCHNRAAKWRHLDAVRKHFSTRKHIHNNCPPFQDHNTTIQLFQDHTLTVIPLQDHRGIHRIGTLKNMFLNFFNKIQYAMQILHYAWPQYPTGATWKVQSPYRGQARDWNTPERGNSTRYHNPYMEPTPWMSSLTYPTRIMGC